MWKYVVKRLLWIVLIMVCVAFIVFTLTYLTPGDPAKMQLSSTGTTPTEAEIQVMREKLGIDKPYLTQLVTYMYNTFIKFDFGISWTYQVPVMTELGNRLPRTVLLGLTNMAISVVVSVALGIFASLNKGKFPDYGLMGLCILLLSVPDFWVAYMLVLIFAVRLQLLPMFGIGSLKHYILPVIAGSIGGIAGNARQTRSAMLETLHADFVNTALSKGQKRGVVIMKHIFPNALMPILTGIGGRFGMIVGGAAILEKVFSIPGVGLYMLTGISSRDYPVIRGCAMFLALFSTLAVLLTDLAYAWLDPRIKAQYSNKR